MENLRVSTLSAPLKRLLTAGAFLAPTFAGITDIQAKTDCEVRITLVGTNGPSTYEALYGMFGEDITTLEPKGETDQYGVLPEIAQHGEYAIMLTQFQDFPEYSTLEIKKDGQLICGIAGAENIAEIFPNFQYSKEIRAENGPFEPGKKLISHDDQNIDIAEADYDTDGKPVYKAAGTFDIFGTGFYNNFKSSIGAVVPMGDKIYIANGKIATLIKDENTEGGWKLQELPQPKDFLVFSIAEVENLKTPSLIFSDGSTSKIFSIADIEKGIFDKPLATINDLVDNVKFFKKDGVEFVAANLLKATAETKCSIQELGNPSNSETVEGMLGDFDMDGEGNLQFINGTVSIESTSPLQCGKVVRSPDLTAGMSQFTTTASGMIDGLGVGDCVEEVTPPPADNDPETGTPDAGDAGSADTTDTADAGSHNPDADAGNIDAAGTPDAGNTDTTDTADAGNTSVDSGADAGSTEKDQGNSNPNPLEDKKDGFQNSPDSTPPEGNNGGGNGSGGCSIENAGLPKNVEGTAAEIALLLGAALLARRKRGQQTETAEK